jgi:hypothetical protein
MMQFWRLVTFVCLASFIGIKVGGTAFAAWSWWWLLMAVVPMMFLLFSHLGVA